MGNQGTDSRHKMTEHINAEPKTTDSGKAMPLGEFLADIRRIKRLSLREVEEATGKDVSNAYLSQLEKGHIKKPSPNILYSLAGVYSIPYATLMEKAGYIVSAESRSNEDKHGRVATFADDNLTNEEEEALLEYLAFLRTKKVQR